MTERRARWLILLVACAPLLVGLGNDIQEFDPTQYAESGRSIAVSGDWMHPRDINGPYDDKPPMAFWLIALAIKAFGATSFAVRLPSLLAVLAAIAATAIAGRELWGLGTGLLAAALFAASPAAQLMVADPKIDADVTAFMTLAVALFLLARRAPALAWPAWICVGCGLLTKGPIAVIAPLAAVLPEALRDARWRSRLQLAAGPAIVALLWLPYGLQHDAHLTYFHLWEQSFGRLTGQSAWRNETTPLFFLHTSLWAFLPFTPALALALFARLRAFVAKRVLPPDLARVPLFWLLVPLAGISASAYKLPQYLYWLGPPAALLAARAIDGELSSRARRMLTALQLLLSLAAPALVALLLAESFPSGSTLGQLGWPLFAGAAAAAGLWLWRRAEFATGLVAAGVAALSACWLFFHAWLHPSVLAYQPDHAFAARAVQEDPAARVLPFVGAVPSNAAGFYAARSARSFSPAQLARAVAEGAACVAIIDPAVAPALQSAGLRVETLLERPLFPTSRPTRAFLNARTREGSVRRLRLVKLALRAP